jgi:AP-4 complex subunit sigma-1
MGVDEYENELAILELIHLIVETLDSYFNNVCELDIMFNLEKAYMILDEVILNGRLVETNQSRILEPIYLIDQTTAKN